MFYRLSRRFKQKNRSTNKNHNRALGFAQTIFLSHWAESAVFLQHSCPCGKPIMYHRTRRHAIDISIQCRTKYNSCHGEKCHVLPGVGKDAAIPVSLRLCLCYSRGRQEGWHALSEPKQTKQLDVCEVLSDESRAVPAWAENVSTNGNEVLTH